MILNLIEGPIPWGGPWITDLFRCPGVAMAGHTALGLVVTDTNPARRLYEKHGFRVINSSVTVVLPDGPASREDGEGTQSRPSHQTCGECA